MKRRNEEIENTQKKRWRDIGREKGKQFLPCRVQMNVQGVLATGDRKYGRFSLEMLRPEQD